MQDWPVTMSQADEMSATWVPFLSISTRVYGYRLAEAAGVSVRALCGAVTAVRSVLLVKGRSNAVKVPWPPPTGRPAWARCQAVRAGSGWSWSCCCRYAWHVPALTSSPRSWAGGTPEARRRHVGGKHWFTSTSSGRPARRLPRFATPTGVGVLQVRATEQISSRPVWDSQDTPSGGRATAGAVPVGRPGHLKPTGAGRLGSRVIDRAAGCGCGC